MDILRKVNIILGGNFNTVKDHNLDTSPDPWHHRPALKFLFNTHNLYSIICGDANMVQSATLHIYLSPTHLSNSHIDYFIADKWTLQNVTSSTIGTIKWSDHAPVL